MSSATTDTGTDSAIQEIRSTPIVPSIELHTTEEIQHMSSPLVQILEEQHNTHETTTSTTSTTTSNVTTRRGALNNSKHREQVAALIMQGRPPLSEHSAERLQQKLNSFWKKKTKELESVTDFKTHQLPLARIKKIMKSDEDVRVRTHYIAFDTSITDAL
jgi:hypothetical protein